MLQSLSVLSLCHPQVLRPALPRPWLLSSILAALHRRLLSRAATSQTPSVNSPQVVLTATCVTLEILKGPKGKVICPSLENVDPLCAPRPGV